MTEKGTEANYGHNDMLARRENEGVAMEKLTVVNCQSLFLPYLLSVVLSR